MQSITTSIIPIQPIFAKTKGKHELNKEAICVFAATGFFLESDTYYKDQVVLSPASEHEIDDAGFLISSKPWFIWNYNPRDIPFDQALKEFTKLFEKITEEQVGNKKVILPLSGGLDSRSQAVALANLKKEVQAYSYDFSGGYPETKIAKQIAKKAGFDFETYHIEKGYLWDSIEELAQINGCYSEFTHPRQMAIFNQFDKMGSVFSLGHWGDVLFDRGIAAKTSEKDLTDIILKKIIKKGGMELATELWKSWELPGNFESYIKERVQSLLDSIKINNVSAKMRAFKSMYWAPRWTSTNLAVFQQKHPITLPYYDDRMCKFICSIPEEYLADRKLQIAYIKTQNPEIAKITWQDHKPFNLYNYSKNRTPFNIPYRIFNKAQRETKSVFGKKYIQRNWELQFLGLENDDKLQEYLFSKNFNSFLPKQLVAKFYNQFRTVDNIKYSHPVSILLTLALWNQKQADE